jgi:penicillin amidase
MYAVYGLVLANLDATLAQLDDAANFDAANGRWPALLTRLLDAQPKGWLPAGKKDWREVQLAAIDRTIADLTRDGTALAAATWGRRNTAKIAHPISRAVSFLRPWLSAPADMLPGDENMPRVAGPGGGQSERMTVSPGKEEQGLFNMPGGQSGHPLSPYFLAGHAEWVRGTPTPLLPGPAVHLLTFVPQR